MTGFLPRSSCQPVQWPSKPSSNSSAASRKKRMTPKKFRNATVVSLFKNRGSKTDCGNYRGISLLSVAGKILARVILNRLITNISEENLPEAQCGFRPNRSTTDMIFYVRQVQNCIDQNLDLVVIFIYLMRKPSTQSTERPFG